MPPPSTSIAMIWTKVRWLRPFWIRPPAKRPAAAMGSAAAMCSRVSRERRPMTA